MTLDELASIRWHFFLTPAASHSLKSKQDVLKPTSKGGSSTATATGASRISGNDNTDAPTGRGNGHRLQPRRRGSLRTDEQPRQRQQDNPSRGPKRQPRRRKTPPARNVRTRHSNSGTQQKSSKAAQPPHQQTQPHPQRRTGPPADNQPPQHQRRPSAPKSRSRNRRRQAETKPRAATKPRATATTAPEEPASASVQARGKKHSRPQSKNAAHSIGKPREQNSPTCAALPAATDSRKASIVAHCTGKLLLPLCNDAGATSEKELLVQ
ncbi:serine/arginine repetitive matrix protein 1-like [Rhineura floridana]|uniref:serine/arginine repetitive matrix protein 1-like n=1 Tax=Rhineura floridana TaxID=261503 RepID=UPI002AC87BB8|nr:serine/arginine repetitive matrix protein 1-like [Rhineura floridana]